MKCVWSGGQTGADRAALDIAIKLNIPHRGYVPRGRLAEDGKIPEHYNLKESYSNSYEKRTELNVMYTDGTVIFCYEETPGSKLTVNYCKTYNKPYKVIDLSKFNNDYQLIRDFIKPLGWVNFAGTRESKAPGIYQNVYDILLETLAPKYVNVNDVD